MLADAYEAGLRGEIDVVEAALGAAERDAWGLALRTLRWFVSDRPRDEDLPTPEALAAHGACPATVRAGLHAIRARSLSGQRDVAAALADALDRLEPRSGWARAGRAWVEITRGRPLDDATLEQSAQAARASGASDLVIELTTLRALGSAERGDLELALRLARQASRMARTESIPQMEHFAHLALARVRRLCGKPHLSTRIIAGLGRVATAPWRPWLAWELLLAQGRRGSGPLAEAPGVAASLDGLLASARGGERASFDGWVTQATAEAATFAPMATDLAWALPAIDPAHDLVGTPAALCAFLRGAAPHEAPRGLAGVCGAEAQDGEHLVWICASAGHSSRRVLAPGLGLARAQLHPSAYVDGSEKQIRTHSAIAVLALAGPEGLDEGELFRALYGFAYEAERHQAVRGVLYGRVRKRLGELGELERAGGLIKIAAAGDLLVCDPRCTPAAELRILAELARRRGAAPKEVATALGISLRSAQDALRRLSEDGALRSERAGRGLHYILEDTTYSEPTRAGRRD